MLRMWADLAALSDLQRGELLNEMATQQPAAVFTAHDQLSQLHSLLLATPAVSHTILTTASHSVRQRLGPSKAKLVDDSSSSSSSSMMTSGRLSHRPATLRQPSPPPPTAPHPTRPSTPPEQQQPDRNPRKFIQWYISCLFPTLHSNTVNYCRINTPWSIVWRWLHTPIAFSHMSPTSWWNALWTWIGVFVGIGCIAILHQYYTNAKHDWPILFASHGALATIIFTTPQNPVVLPYAMFGGTLVSTFYAVVIQRGMNTDEWLWLGCGAECGGQYYDDAAAGLLTSTGWCVECIVHCGANTASARILVHYCCRSWCDDHVLGSVDCQQHTEARRQTLSTVVVQLTLAGAFTMCVLIDERKSEVLSQVKRC